MDSILLDHNSQNLTIQHINSRILLLFHIHTHQTLDISCIMCMVSHLPGWNFPSNKNTHHLFQKPLFERTNAKIQRKEEKNSGEEKGTLVWNEIKVENSGPRQ